MPTRASRLHAKSQVALGRSKDFLTSFQLHIQKISEGISAEEQVSLASGFGLWCWCRRDTRMIYSERKVPIYLVN